MADGLVDRGKLEMLCTASLGVLHWIDGQEPEIYYWTSSSHEDEFSVIEHTAFLFVKCQLTPCCTQLPCQDERCIGQAWDDVRFRDMVWQPWDAKVAGVCRLDGATTGQRDCHWVCCFLFVHYWCSFDKEVAGCTQVRNSVMNLFN